MALANNPWRKVRGWLDFYKNVMSHNNVSSAPGGDSRLASRGTPTEKEKYTRDWVDSQSSTRDPWGLGFGFGGWGLEGQ